jgi:hypothetical protein
MKRAYALKGCSGENGDDHGGGVVLCVCQAHGYVLHAERGGGGGGGAVELDAGLTVLRAGDFYFHQRSAGADAAAESFGDGFLGGPAGGVGLIAAGVLLAPGALGSGEDTFQKRLALLRNGAGDARCLHEINAWTNVHAVPEAPAAHPCKRRCIAG